MTSTTFDARTTTRPASLPTARREMSAPARALDAQPVAPTLRLTRRGRVVVLIVVLLAALGAFATWGAPAASTDVVHHPKTVTVIVSPGETVWDIAQRVAPQADTRSTVAEIEELNSLSDAGSIRVGEPLYVPTG